MNAVLIQRVEGAVFLMLSLWVYTAMGASWVLFALLILIPDILMLEKYGA